VGSTEDCPCSVVSKFIKGLFSEGGQGKGTDGQ
jgi:hypothetical protein